MESFFQAWIKSAKTHNISTIKKKIDNLLESKNFKIEDMVNFGGIPVPIFESEENYEKLAKLTLELPQGL